MTPEELAELECHLAAETALAALPRETKPGKFVRHDPAFQVGMYLGLVAVIAYWVWAFSAHR